MDFIFLSSTLSFSGWILRFILGKGLYGSRVRLVINPDQKEFIFEEPKKIEDFDSFIDYPCDSFGSFRLVILKVLYVRDTFYI